MGQGNDVVFGEQLRIGHHRPHAIALGLACADCGCGFEDFETMIFEQDAQLLPFGGVTL